MNILFASQVEKAEDWLPLLQKALPKDRFFAAPEKDIDIALVATPPKGTFQKLPNLKFVQSLWMGVEKLLDSGPQRVVTATLLVEEGGAYSLRAALDCGEE